MGLKSTKQKRVSDAFVLFGGWRTAIQLENLAEPKGLCVIPEGGPKIFSLEGVVLYAVRLRRSFHGRGFR